MVQDSSRFLPLMAEALKDIYAKMDDITRKLNDIAEILQQFFTSIGSKNMLIMQNLKKLQGTIVDMEKGDSLKTTIQLINESVADIQDGMWFLEFQKVLKRFQEKIAEF